MSSTAHSTWEIIVEKVLAKKEFIITIGSKEEAKRIRWSLYDARKKVPEEHPWRKITIQVVQDADMKNIYNLVFKPKDSALSHLHKELLNDPN